MADRDAELERADQEIARAVSEALDEVAAEFAERVGAATELVAAPWSVGGIARMWQGRVAGLVRRLLGVSGRAARAAADDIGSALPDGWDDLPGRYEHGRALPHQIGQYVETTEALLRAVGDTLAESARRELAAGLDRGEDIDQLRDRLRAAFDREGAQLGPGREERIAATEAARAWNTATLAAASASSSPDQPMVKQWVSRGDRRVRSAHRQADGQVRALDQPFDVGGSQLSAPGDPNAPSALVVGCRCRLRITPQDLAASIDSQDTSPPELSEPRESTVTVDTDSTVTAEATATGHVEAAVTSTPPQEAAPEQETALETTRQALYAAVQERAGAWRPDVAWFEPPTDGDREQMESGEQPLISDDGRVLGYVATFRQADGNPTLHLGYADVGEYVPVPAKQDYTYFHQRNINYPLSDGTSAHVGIITDHGHPSQSDSPQQQIAIVRVGEDDAGVWIAGAVFPDVRDSLMRFSRIKASAISGEWTSDGSFRGAAMVNHPGFPQSTTASQDFYALAASVQGASTSALSTFRDQLAEMLDTVTTLLEQGDGDEGDAEQEEQPDYPDGVDSELVTAALAIVKEGGLTAASAPPYGVELPQSLAILADWLAGTGEATSQQSRAASIKAAQEICRSPEKQHVAVRARACRLLSEYKVKGGK